MLKKLAGVVCGLLLAFATIYCLETLSGQLFPLPPGTDPADLNAIKAAIAQMPVAAFLLILGGWLLGTFLGAMLAIRIAGGNRIPGLVVGALLFAGSILNLLMLPHPAWFWGLTLAGFPLVIYAATHLTRSAVPGEPLATSRHSRP